MTFKKEIIDKSTKIVKDYLQDIFPSYDMKRLERALNWKAIHADYKYYRKKRKMREEEISDIIRKEIEKEAGAGGVGKYFSTGPARRLFRKIKQKEFKGLSTGLYYLTHPIRGISDGFERLLFGYEPDSSSKSQRQIDQISSNIGNFYYSLPQSVRGLFDYLRNLISYKRLINAFEMVGFISPREAKSKKYEIKKNIKKFKKGVTKSKVPPPPIPDLEAIAKTAVVLIFLVGVSLIGYSLFEPSVTGYIVLESGQNVSLGIIFGIALIVVAFGFWFMKRILKNQNKI